MIVELKPNWISVLVCDSNVVWKEYPDLFSSWLSGKNGEEKDFINYFVEFVELVNYDSLNG
jgi:hypothetical protein